jgi:hypothetical protein
MEPKPCPFLIDPKYHTISGVAECASGIICHQLTNPISEEEGGVDACQNMEFPSAQAQEKAVKIVEIIQKQGSV